MTPEIIPVDKALWEQMCQFARDEADMQDWNSASGQEARAIVAQLPTPVDPLVLRAREICAGEAERRWGKDYYDAKAFRAGHLDDTHPLQCTLAALREKEAG